MAKRFAFKVIFAAAMMGSLLMARTTQMKADERDETCKKRIHRAEVKLRQAVRRNGENSKQAEERRAELKVIREKCHYDTRTNKQS